MKDNGQILFRYATAEGEVTPAANPNGSVENIAGVCNENKNVLGDAFGTCRRSAARSRMATDFHFVPKYWG